VVKLLLVDRLREVRYAKDGSHGIVCKKARYEDGGAQSVGRSLLHRDGANIPLPSNKANHGNHLEIIATLGISRYTIMEQILMTLLIVPATFAASGVVEQVQKRRGSFIQAEKPGYESAFLAHFMQCYWGNEFLGLPYFWTPSINRRD